VTGIRNDVHYDPYDVTINADPYPTYRRLRDEAPLYRNEPHDFYAVSRYAEVERALKERDTFISGRGSVLELIHSGIDSYPGTVIFEDPPAHTIHRGLLSRMFTPRKVAALEPQMRAWCADILDPLVGTARFDLIADFAAHFPARVIGMLVGIPDKDLDEVHARTNASLRTEDGQPMDPSGMTGLNDLFSEYIDWRVDHPSDDIMTELLNAEFDDEHGVRRRLSRDELLTYVSIVAGAGNETTTRLIGWGGKVLAENPDQRRLVAEDRSLIPACVEELLRYEPPAPHVARYAVKDAEFEGGVVPAGSALLCVAGAANRDDRRFDDPDRFDVRRPNITHLTFSHGAHFCLGASLARLEARVALDELVTRWPTWDVDLTDATLSPTSTVRGWEALPFLPG
jgi:cytochrome P450